MPEPSTPSVKSRELSHFAVGQVYLRSCSGTKAAKVTGQTDLEVGTHPTIISMTKRRSNSARHWGDPFALPRPRKAVPHPFVLEALAELNPRTNPMFGCLAVYVGEKIVLVLRDKSPADADNGVWLATTMEHHASLRREFPSMRSIKVFGKPVTGWQVLPASAPDFEKAALHACELVIARDPRIGKVPKKKNSRRTKPSSRN